MPTTQRKPKVSRPRVELDENSPDIRVRFALKLRGLMEKKGWSSADLAERIDVNNRAIDAWMRARSMPQPETLEPLARAFGISDYRKILPEPL